MKTAPPPTAGDALLTAQELASMLRMSVTTLYRALKKGPPARSTFDVRHIPSEYINGKRFWSRAKAEEFVSKIGS